MRRTDSCPGQEGGLDLDKCDCSRLDAVPRGLDALLVLVDVEDDALRLDPIRIVSTGLDK